MMSLLLDHLWQSTVLAGGAALLAFGLRNNGANVRFWVWFAASVKFLLPFAILTDLGSYFLAPIAPRLHAPALMLMQPVAQPFSGATLYGENSPVTPAATNFDLTFLLLALWATGFAVLSIRWFVRWSQLRLLVRDAVDLKVVAPIAVKSSSSRIEPGLVGIVQPIILLPEGIDKQLSPAEMSTIVAHELCHWRRRDNLLAAIHMLVEALFWFFPLVWWLGARLNAERERACDESVLAAGGDPTTYAEGILKVCRLYLQSPLACAAGVSGGGLKKRMDVIMENRFLVRLDGPRKSLLATIAATAIVVPLSSGLLTAAPAKNTAMAQPADAPHAGTKAALRRQLEGWERKQPALEDMTASMVSATKQQQATIQTMINGWGSLKSITFKENGVQGGDVYLVEFENGSSVWTVQPLQGGKIGGMFFQPVEKRADNGPSPGVEAAIRRNYEGLLKGAPAYDIMAPALINVSIPQVADLEQDAKNLGALKTLTFTKVNAQGWDVYAATFDKGTAIWRVHPLTDGKLTGILWSDIHEPDAPAHPGTEASLRRYVESLQKGQPNYEEMGPALAASVKQSLPDVLATIKPWGALKSIVFKGGGSRGVDVYDVTFAHGKAEWAIGPITPDGKVERRNFRPLS